jgi:hypothetical protein
MYLLDVSILPLFQQCGIYFFILFYCAYYKIIYLIIKQKKASQLVDDFPRYIYINLTTH